MKHIVFLKLLRVMEWYILFLPESEQYFVQNGPTYYEIPTKLPDIDRMIVGPSKGPETSQNWPMEPQW